MPRRSGPVRRALRGALAGVAGTFALDLVWYGRAPRPRGGPPAGAAGRSARDLVWCGPAGGGGGGATFLGWETARDLRRGEAAPPPGRGGRKILAPVTKVDPPVEQAPAISNAM